MAGFSGSGYLSSNPQVQFKQRDGGEYAWQK